MNQTMLYKIFFKFLTLWDFHSTLHVTLREKLEMEKRGDQAWTDASRWNISLSSMCNMTVYILANGPKSWFYICMQKLDAVFTYGFYAWIMTWYFREESGGYWLFKCMCYLRILVYNRANALNFYVKYFLFSF